MIRKECIFCGEVFNARSKKNNLCSDYCRKQHYYKLYSIRQKEIQEISKEIGNCTQCGKEKDNIKYLRCSNCRRKGREAYRRRNDN